MIHIHRQRFLAAWALLSLLAWPLGGALFAAVVEVTATGTCRLSAQVNQLIGHRTWILIRESVAITAMGAGVGLAQWLLLRQRIRRATHWIWATGGGLTLGRLLEGGLMRILHPVNAPLQEALAFGATVGIGLGLGQWLVLRSKVSGSGWWIGASVTGTLLGGTIVVGALLLLDHFYTRQPCCISPADAIVTPLVALGMFGITRETVTGLTLAHLLQRALPGEEPI